MNVGLGTRLLHTLRDHGSGHKAIADVIVSLDTRLMYAARTACMCAIDEGSR